MISTWWVQHARHAAHALHCTRTCIKRWTWIINCQCAPFPWQKHHFQQAKRLRSRAALFDTPSFARSLSLNAGNSQTAKDFPKGLCLFWNSWNVMKSIEMSPNFINLGPIFALQFVRRRKLRAFFFACSTRVLDRHLRSRPVISDGPIDGWAASYLKIPWASPVALAFNTAYSFVKVSTKKCCGCNLGLIGPVQI